MSEQTKTDSYDGIREETNKPPVYFNVFYYGAILWGALFCAYFILSGWSSRQEFKEDMQVYQQEYAVERSSGY